VLMDNGALCMNKYRRQLRTHTALEIGNKHDDFNWHEEEHSSCKS